MSIYDAGELLCKGSQGRVYLCADRRYVRKQYKRLPALNNELAIYNLLEHYSWMPTLVDVLDDSLIIERCDCDLFTVMDDTSLPLQYKLHLLGQLANVLTDLHSVNVAHCDIKPENVLIKDNLVKLCDFASSVICGVDSDGKIRGTTGYMSPNLYADGYVGTMLDDWAYAVTTLEVLSGLSLVPVDEPELLDSLYSNQLTDCQLKNTEIAISKQLEDGSPWVSYPLSWRLIASGWDDNTAVKMHNIMKSTLLGERPIPATELYKLVRDLYN